MLNDTIAAMFIKTQFVISAKVNEVNIGGDLEIGCSVHPSACVYMMTHHHLHMSYTTRRNGGALL